MKASPINFRAFLVIASAVILAVLCSYIYTLSRIAGIALDVLLLAVVACIFVICLLKYKRNTVKLRVVIACGLAFLLSVTAFSVATATFDNWERGLSYGGYREVYGRVCAVDTRTGSYRIYLENVVFDGDKAPGNICVTISASDNNIADVVKCGDRLSFSAYISAAKLVDGYSVDGSAYRTNTRYFAAVKSENIKIDFGKPNIIERFLSALKNLLVNNMGDHYGNIAFSLFSGDKHTLYTGVTDYYSAAGLGHILAVSGLHIGFLAIILNLVLFKVGKKARFPIITAVLVLYAVLADFSPSVMRAVIMTVISMLSLFVGGRRDMLSSMLCAGSAILAFKPFYLFEAGFLLSFGSIFGIALFARSITEFFMRHGAHRKVAESIGVSVSVTLGIAPPMIFFFNKLSALGILVNIVAIPFVSIVYIVLIFTAIIGAIPYAGGVLLLCKYLLVPLDMAAYGISLAPYASITVYSTAAVFLCYPIMFCASEFFMVCKGKPMIVLYSALACIALCAVGLPRENHTLAVVQCSENTSIVCTDGKTYIVGYMGDEYAVRCALKKLRGKSVDGMYLLGINDAAADDIITLKRSFDIGTVYGISSQNSVRLMENGINFDIYDGNGQFVLEKAGGEPLGFLYNGILFAANGADERAFSVYDRVRTVSISAPTDGVTYYCNYAAAEFDGVYTTANGAYNIYL